MLNNHGGWQRIRLSLRILGGNHPCIELPRRSPVKYSYRCSPGQNRRPYPMYKIVEARSVGLNIKQFGIEAPRIAAKQQPGQFLILRLHEKGERIPLTIKCSDPKAGTVTIVVQGIGKTTSLLNSLETGDFILDIVGPLGRPSEIENYGTAVILAGSVGTAMALPTANALKQAGNHVVFIEGSRNKEMVVFEDEVRQASSETYI